MIYGLIILSISQIITLYMVIKHSRILKGSKKEL